MSEKFRTSKIEGLEVYFIKGIHAPYFTCQLCKKRVRHKQNEGMAFSNDEGGGMIAHKTCMSRLKDNYNLYPNSTELRHFLFDLQWNIQVEPEDTEMMSEQRTLEEDKKK